MGSIFFPTLIFHSIRKITFCTVNMQYVIRQFHKDGYNTIQYYILQLLRDEADINIEMIANVASNFGKPTQELYYVDLNFMEVKAKLKPAYLNVLNTFDAHTWLGILISFICVCLCHQITLWSIERNITLVRNASNKITKPV